VSITEKVLLVVSVLLSWGFGALIWFLFSSGFSVELILSLIVLGILMWLTPFFFLSLFFKKLYIPLAAFVLGSLGFLLVEINIYIILGLVVLALGFIYWYMRVLYARDNAPGFSILHSFRGIGIFFTVVAAFGSLLYLYSPFSVRAYISLEPKVPEVFFEVVFRTFSRTSLFEVGETSFNTVQDPSALKPQIYDLANEVLAELAQRYQRYIPFVFAAGAFIFLRVILFVLRYIIVGIIFLLVHFFLYLGLLHKGTVQVPREIVRFSQSM
jgi:hypothetical protein